MPLNLELKIQLNNFDDVISRLQNINASNVGTINQKDIYYKVEGKLLKLRILDDNKELIQYCREESGERFSSYEILSIQDMNAENFFGMLFETEAIVIKKRILYMFDNTRIHLDEVKNLGFFLELETLVLAGNEEAVIRFNKLVELLNLDVTNQIRKSYRDLIIEQAK